MIYDFYTKYQPMILNTTNINNISKFKRYFGGILFDNRYCWIEIDMVGMDLRCTIDIRNKNQWTIYCNSFEELNNYLISMSMNFNILEFKEYIENMIHEEVSKEVLKKI